MSPEIALKILSWLLILLGGLAICAVIPMVMPTDWMEAANDWLGLGPFHSSPLVEYLTRSLSLLYALFGALAVYLGIHARRYLWEIVLAGWLTVVLGAALTAIDFAVGMPASWSWGEGPPTVVIGLAFVWLARRAGVSSPS